LRSTARSRKAPWSVAPTGAQYLWTTDDEAEEELRDAQLAQEVRADLEARVVNEREEPGPCRREGEVDQPHPQDAQGQGEEDDHERGGEHPQVADPDVPPLAAGEQCLDRHGGHGGLGDVPERRVAVQRPPVVGEEAVPPALQAEKLDVEAPDPDVPVDLEDADVQAGDEPGSQEAGDHRPPGGLRPAEARPAAGQQDRLGLAE
jgi:hypothetical protein